MSGFIDKIKAHWGVEELKFVATFTQPKNKETGQYKGDFGFFINLKNYDSGKITYYPKEIKVKPVDRKVSIYINNVLKKGLVTEQKYYVSINLDKNIISDKNPLGIKITEILEIDQAETLEHFKNLKEIENNISKNNIELELKDFWGIDKFRFIASVVKSTKGDFFLKNIRKENGEAIKFPNGRRVIINTRKNTQLNINNEYLVEAYVDLDKRTEDNKYSLFLDFKNNPPKKYLLPTQEYINKLRAEFEETKGIAKDTILGSLRRLTAETNKKPETFIFELIQNADDYPDPDNPDVHVSFNIVDNNLILTHNGLPFQQKNVYAICTVDAGDKKDDVNKTGFKGIGFKSIFKFSNHVWINSGDYSFKFDKNFFEKQGKEMPWQVIPIWKEPENIDEETRVLLNNPVSIFIRPTEGRSKLIEIEHIFNSVFRNNDRVLLFLRNVRSISFNTFREKFKIEIDNNKWAISNIDSVIIPEEIRERLYKAADTDDRVPEKYKNIIESEITFATEINKGEIVKTEDSRLYAYLPTDWDFGFDFLINGDFIPDGSRDRLFDDIEWNTYLFQQAGTKFIEWIKELAEKFQGESSYNILPDIGRLIDNERDRAKKIFLQKFKEGYDTGVSTIPFLKSRDDEFKKLNELILDKTFCAEIFPDEVLSLIFSNDINLLHVDLSENNNVIKIFKKYAKDNIFDWNELKLKIPFLENWLKEPSNNAVFLNFLIIKEEIDLFDGIEIVLDQNGELNSYSNLYYEIPNNDLDLLSFIEFPYLNEEVKKLLVSDTHIIFKQYEVSEFIKEYIVNKKDIINIKINDFHSSLSFYEYLAKYQNKLPPLLINELKEFCFVDINNNLCNSINEEHIYLENETISSLLINKCIPQNQIRRLSSEYIINDDAIQLWKKLGIKDFNEVSITIFIFEEFCNKINFVNTHLQNLYTEDYNLYKTAIRGIIQFLELHIDKLATQNLNQLKSLHLFIGNINMNLCPQNMNLNMYFEDSRINKLKSNKCFPDNHFYILPESYLLTELSMNFWSKMGVFTFKNGVASFFSVKISRNINEINKHVESLHQNNLITSLLASRTLLEFYASCKEFLTATDINNCKKLLSGLKIVNSNGELTIIKDSYLSKHYTDKADVEELLKGFPEIPISFISEKYTYDSELSTNKWKYIFIHLKAQNDNKEFIEQSLIPQFNNISKINLISATQLLFENRKELVDVISEIREFNVLTKNDELVKASDVKLGSYYLEDGVVKQFTEQFEFENEISLKYTNSNLNEWICFFNSLGVPKIHDQDIISEGIDILLEKQEVLINENKHQILFDSIFDLHKSEYLLKDDYIKLKCWKILAYNKGINQTYFTEASSVLFSNIYNPKIQFENFDLKNDVFFLSHIYAQEINESQELISFFLEIGVRDTFVCNRVDDMHINDMPIAYTDFIDENHPEIAVDKQTNGNNHLVKSWIDVPFLSLIINPEINKIFWNALEEDSSFGNAIFNEISYKIQHESIEVETEPLSYLKTNKILPNLLGKLCLPGELYDKSLKDLLKDDSLISDIGFDSIQTNTLGIKTELDFIACLNILKREEKRDWLKKKRITTKFKDHFTYELSDYEKDKLEKFNENGTLLNQTLEWVPINKLHVVDSSFKLGIKRNPYLLHADFKDFFAEFDVKKLSAKDFNFESKNKQVDDNLKPILIKRAKYLSFLINEKTWEDDWDKYESDLSSILSKVEKLNFFTCKKLSLTYKDEDITIENSEFDFYSPDSSNDYYFIGRWDRVRAAEMYPRLHELLIPKISNSENSINEKVFKDIIFAECNEDILDYFKENNIELPSELNPSKSQVEPIVDTIPAAEEDEEVESEPKSEPGDTKSLNRPTPEPIQNEQVESEQKCETADIESLNKPTTEPIQEVEQEKTLEEILADKLTNNTEISDNEKPFLTQPNERYSATKEGLATGRTDLTLKEQKQVHENNYKRGKQILEKEGYDFTFAIDYGYKVANIITPGNVNIDLIFKSANGGLLHLNSYHWNELGNSETALFIAFGGNEFKLFPSKYSLLNDDLNENILFRIKNRRKTIDIDNIFKNINDENGQLILVTSQNMKKKLYEQFDVQRNLNPVKDTANATNFDY